MYSNTSLLWKQSQEHNNTIVQLEEKGEGKEDSRWWHNGTLLQGRPYGPRCSTVDNNTHMGCVCTCILKHLHTCGCRHIHRHMQTHAHTHACMHTHIHTHTHINTHTCTHACTHMHAHTVLVGGRGRDEDKEQVIITEKRTKVRQNFDSGVLWNGLFWSIMKTNTRWGI